MQQNMGSYSPVIQKEKFGAILILMVIRVIAGAVIGTMTGLAMVVQPLSGGYGMLTMIAGFLCVPAAILFFMRKPAFKWAFLIMAVLNAIGGIVIAAHPAMQLASMFLPAQKIFLILIIIMDALFIVYLIRSKKVASVFGGTLFTMPGAAPYKAQPNQAYAAPYQNQPVQAAQNYEPQQPVEPVAGQPYEPVQEQPYTEPVQEQMYEPVQGQAYAQQASQYQPGYVQPGPVSGQQNQQYYQPQPQYAQGYAQPKPRREMKRGAFVGLCIGISAAAVIVIALVMNNYYSNKYSSSSLFGSGSLFGSDYDDDSSGLDGFFGSIDGAEDWLFGSSGDSYEDEDASAAAADLAGYVDSEINRSVESNLYEMLKPGRSVEVSNIVIEADSYGLYIECYLPEDYYVTGWEELNSDANEQNRKSVAAVFKEDIYEKTGIQDAEIVFIYYDEDGYYMTEYYY